MNVFKDNKDLYPSTDKLCHILTNPIDWIRVRFLLEPSAGSAKILNFVKDLHHYKNYRYKIFAIEKDQNLRNMLIGANWNVCGTDFLTYSGLTQFDTILMNPPFSNGEDHLLKAIQILYSGQISCVLNAQTIKNPNTTKKLALLNKLKELNATIEFHQHIFRDPTAERKSSVEIAHIYINVVRDLHEDLLKNCNDFVKPHNDQAFDDEIKDVANKDSIISIVDSYNLTCNKGIQFIHSYYSQTKYLSGYLTVVGSEETNRFRKPTIQELTNSFLDDVRFDYWNKVIKLPDFQKRLTEEKTKQFVESIKKHSNLEFTVSNIRAFFDNLINSYENTLIDAVESIFDAMTYKYSWFEAEHNKTVRYYNGWKTNDSFMVNKKVILPYIRYNSWGSGWTLQCDCLEKLNDIDKVMNYFEGKSSYTSIEQATKPFKSIVGQLIESEFFKLRFYKKGTLHLTFKSEDLRRRFNIMAGKKKGWLPADYGNVPFEDLPPEKQNIVTSFDDSIEIYNKNINQLGFKNTENLLLSA